MNVKLHPPQPELTPKADGQTQRPELAGQFSGHRISRIPSHVKEGSTGLESILPLPLSSDAAYTAKLRLDVHRTREVLANCRSPKNSED